MDYKGPRQSKEDPKENLFKQFSFQEYSLYKSGKTGATVPKIVALATDVSLTALKKQAK